MTDDNKTIYTSPIAQTVEASTDLLKSTNPILVCYILTIGILGGLLGGVLYYGFDRVITVMTGQNEALNKINDTLIDMERGISHGKHCNINK